MASQTLGASATSTDHAQVSDSTYSSQTEQGPWVFTGADLATIDADNVYSASGGNTNARSLRLDVKNFGFTIPSGATIDGVVAQITWRSANSGRSNYELQIRICKGGSPTGNNKAANTKSTTTYTTVTHGGAADLWGTTLTDSDVNASDFGLSVQYSTDVSQATRAVLDCVQLTVYYTEGGGAGSAVARRAFPTPILNF